MSLTEYYTRQLAWRDWATVFAELPPIAGHRVLDLGCGVGDQAAELVGRGAKATPSRGVNVIRQIHLRRFAERVSWAQ
jgi:trans-aconitate methyltransferase